MRVRLPQRHGALGAVATLLGHAGANISRLQVRVKDERGAVVDFLLDAPDDPDGDPLVDLAVEELDRLADVVVEEVTHYPAGGGLHYDLEVIERMRSGTGDPARVLATAAPLLCQAEWAAVVDVPRCTVEFQTSLAPALGRGELAHLAPYDSTHTSVLGSGPQGRVAVATIPLPATRALVIGRTNGPDFAAAELARLTYLAATSASRVTGTSGPDEGCGSHPGTLGGPGPGA